MVEPAIDSPGPNAIGAALGLLGDEWSLLIIRQAFTGVRTYGGFKSHLAISDAVLSARLATLTRAGVLARAADNDEYLLSERGTDLWRLMLCIWAWEQDYVVAHRAALPTMVHASCGHEFRPVLRCTACVAPVATDDIDVRFGPSGGFTRSAPVGATRRRSSRTATASDEPGLFPETMAIIGSRWSSAILGATFLGARRFRDFERLLGAPPSVIAGRLKLFVELDVLHQSGTAYELTPKGRALLPVVGCFVAWGERWLPAPDGPAILATHRQCGKFFVPQLACNNCSAELSPEAIEITPSLIAADSSLVRELR
ncbi:MAG TPA: helix-turn-helix domain-containing protein [Ilumatobacteraceae bacterium]|nr:helix-turn-helix domain-containing protein [Ilumatobacteraceae bacterium]HRB03341.1 helix-turn-helix domain-containing protein [Ilumatobacteraceae bacterium]